MLSDVFVMRLSRLPCRRSLDWNPKTKSAASMMFDFPLPLGPMTHVMLLLNGPTVTLPAYLSERSGMG